jgi:hypothetical protein
MLAAPLRRTLPNRLSPKGLGRELIAENETLGTGDWRRVCARGAPAGGRFRQTRTGFRGRAARPASGL